MRGMCDDLMTVMTDDCGSGCESCERSIRRSFRIKSPDSPGRVGMAHRGGGLRLRLGTCNGVSNHGGPWQGTFFVLRQREITTVAAITPNASTTGTEIGDSACILQW